MTSYSKNILIISAFSGLLNGGINYLCLQLAFIEDVISNVSR